MQACNNLLEFGEGSQRNWVGSFLFFCLCEPRDSSDPSELSTGHLHRAGTWKRRVGTHVCLSGEADIVSILEKPNSHGPDVHAEGRSVQYPIEGSLKADLQTVLD